MGVRDRLNSVNLELDGRKLVNASSRRPRVDIHVVRTEGGVTTYDIDCSFKTEIGYTPASMTLDAHRPSTSIDGQNKLHMFHLDVPEGIRGNGLGSILFNIFKEYAVKGDFSKVSLRVGGGEDTKGFLVNNGVNPEYLTVHNFPGARVTSVVLTTQSNFKQIKGIRSVKETSDQIEGVFTDVAFK